MAIDKFQFLDEGMLTVLATQLFTKSNIRISERIVTTIDENSSSKVVPSSKALYNLLSTINSDNTDLSGRVDEHEVQIGNHGDSLTALQTSQDQQDEKLTNLETDLGTLTGKVGNFMHLTIETVTGAIETVADPSDAVLYFQRDDESDTTWMLYLHQNGQWINIGDTEVDLSVIWSKDETDDLRETLGVHEAEPLSDDILANIVDSADSENTVELRATPTGEPTVAREIEVGTPLSAHPISGSMKYGNVDVPGTFTWLTTDEEYDAMVNAE